MKKAIPLGISDYRELQVNNYYTIDKTMMIKEFLESKTKVTLITRPRRFGKTLNMSMMSKFFDITKDSQNLFKNTLIASTPYIHEMNKYPTIFMSFANAKGNKEITVEIIKKQILNAYKKNKEALNEIDFFDQSVYKGIIDGLNDFRNGTLDDVVDALSFLMAQLESYYSKKAMVFIDE